MTFYLDPTYHAEFEQNKQPIVNNIPTINSLSIGNAPSLFFYDTNLQPRQFDPVASGLVNQAGNIIPVDGYSFVDYKVFQQLQKYISTSSSEESCTQSISCDTLSSHSVPLASVFPKVYSVSKPAAMRRKLIPGYRSKQQLIEDVHSELVESYGKLGLHAGESYLRGNDTVRIQVKTIPALKNIVDVVKEIHLAVDIKELISPISMKNKHQKKGLTLYIKLASENDVPKVQEIVTGKHSEIYGKCDIARSSRHQANSEPTELETSNSNA